MTVLPEFQEKSKYKVEYMENVPLETALELTGFGKYNYLLLFVMSISMLASILDSMSMVMVTPASSCDLETTLGQKGFLIAIPYLGLVMMCYPWGYISDTKGRKLSLQVAMTGGFVFSLLSCFSWDVASIAVFKFVAGAFSSAANSVSYTMLGEFQPYKYKDRMVYHLTTMIMAGGIYMGCIAIPILVYTDFSYPIGFLGIALRPWRLYLLIVSFLLALAAILVTTLTDETPKFLMMLCKQEESLRVLRKMYASNTGKPEDSYPVASLQPEDNKTILENNFLKSLWTQLSPLFTMPLLKNTAILYFIQFGSYFVSNTLVLWVSYISIMFLDGLKREDHGSVSFCTVMMDSFKNTENSTIAEPIECVDTLAIGVPLVMMAVSGVMAVSNFGLSASARLIGKKYLLISIMVAVAICAILSSIINNLWTGFILNLLQMGGSLSMGLTTSYCVDLFPTRLRGMAVCLAIMIGRCGGMVGTNIYGAVLENYCNEIYYVNGAVLLAVAAVATLLPGAKRPGEGS